MKTSLTIEYDRSRPIGMQLRERIVERIKAREWVPGDQLPSIRSLQQETGISLCLIRKVISELADEGYLRLHQGKGIFIADPLSGPKNIALVLPCIGPEHITSIIKGVREELSKVAANLVLHAGSDNYNQEADIIAKLDNSYVAGALIYPPPVKTYASYLKELKKRRVPTVMINTVMKDLDIDSVSVNHWQLGHRSMAAMLEKGHRHIGILGVHSDVASYQEMLSGMQQAATEFDVDYDRLPKYLGNPLNIDPNHPWEMFYGLIGGFLAANPELTGLVCLNENIAMGAFLGLKKMGKRIPEDISLVAHGTLEAFKVCEPAISCVTVSYEDMGRLAVTRMLQLLSPGRFFTPSNLQLDPVFIERQSIRTL